MCRAILYACKLLYSRHLNVSRQFNVFFYSALGVVARTNAFYGQGTGPILRDNVACTGRETRLRDCRYYSPDYYDRHYEDAGVECHLLGSKLKISVYENHYKFSVSEYHYSSKAFKIIIYM